MIRVREMIVEDIFEMLICLVEEWFYFANIGGIIDDSFLEANRAIVIYFCNEERTHELLFVLRISYARLDFFHQPCIGGYYGAYFRACCYG